MVTRECEHSLVCLGQVTLLEKSTSVSQATVLSYVDVYPTARIFLVTMQSPRKWDTSVCVRRGSQCGVITHGVKFMKLAFFHWMVDTLLKGSLLRTF